MSHVLKGQECNILWLRKGDILSPFVDSYARGLKCSHKHLFNYCELQWIIYQCSQFSLHVTIICIIIVAGGGHALFFLLSSLLILHGASVMYCCNIYHILAWYCHHWYSCSYDLWYSCCWMHPCFALVNIVSLILQCGSSMLYCYNIYHTFINDHSFLWYCRSLLSMLLWSLIFLLVFNPKLL